MNESSLARDASIESLVGRIADEFLVRQNKGEHPDVEDYAARHPEAADLLRKVLASLKLLDGSRWAEGEGRESPDYESPVELGDFRIVREIGRGGMGIVYEAEQISLGRRVALKILPLAGVLDSRRLERFKNESRAAAGLHHSAIVPIYSIGCERGVHYYAMQFIDGATLAAIVAELRQRAVSSEDAAKGSLTSIIETPGNAADPTSRTSDGREHCRRMAQLAAIVAEALDYAHQQGVVHRDIKPANLLLDRDGRLWVTDFGLARIEADVGVTLTGDVLGTLRYMSPEQILAKRGVVDERSDVYSLGATLYELLTLRPAYDGEDRASLLRQIASDDPPKPRSLNSNIPTELETIVVKSLEKNPGDRYATAADFADDLRRHLEDRPILARPASAGRRMVKWLRRHKPLSAALAATAGTVLFAGVVGLIFHLKAEAETARRRVATNGRIAEALAAAVRAREGGSLPADDALAREKARELVREAVTLSESEWADGQLANQSRELLAELNADADDRRLLASLDEAWIEETLADDRDHQFQYDLVAMRVMKAFDVWGLKPLKTPVEDAANRIEQRPGEVQPQIVAALERWSRAISRRKEPGHADATERRWLKELVDRVDADAWRRRLREAIDSDDAAALADLAKSESVAEQPVYILQVLGEKLTQVPEYDDAGAMVLETAARRSPDDFWIHYTLFDRHMLAQPPRFDEALRHASMAVALRKHVASAHVILGRALHGAGRTTEAIAAVGEAIRLDPNYATAYNVLGRALFDLPDLAGAAQAYRQAFKIYPKFAEAHNNLGIVLIYMDDVPEAIAEFRLALELRPNYVGALDHLGMSLRSRGDLLGGLAAHQQAVDTDPSSFRSQIHLGNVLADIGELRQAEAVLRESVKLRPNDAEGHVSLGVALHKGGQFSQAQEEFEYAISLDPNLPEARREFGHFLEQTGMMVQAAEERMRLIELTPTDPQPHFDLGAVLKMQGKFADALAALRRGHALGIQTPTWRQPSDEWIKECERLIELERRLPGEIRESDYPKTAEESIELAEVCRLLKRSEDAVNLYERAFQLAPALTNDLAASHRYRAACAAALAGSIEPSERLADDVQRHREFRGQALRWLREDLNSRMNAAELASAKALYPIVKALEEWRTDPQLLGVRQPGERPDIAREECAAWGAFWADVESRISELRAEISRQP